MKEETRNPLEDQPFSYRHYKNGNVSISFKHKEITLLKGKAAQKFLIRVKNGDAMEEQMAMAKVTGNFKHGNEREGKLKGR